MWSTPTTTTSWTIWITWGFGDMNPLLFASNCNVANSIWRDSLDSLPILCMRLSIEGDGLGLEVGFKGVGFGSGVEVLMNFILGDHCIFGSFGSPFNTQLSTFYIRTLCKSICSTFNSAKVLQVLK